MTADVQLRKRDMEDFCGNPYLYPLLALHMLGCAVWSYLKLSNTDYTD